MNEKIISDISDKAIANIVKSKDALVHLINEHDDDIGKFIERVLVWYSDSKKKQLLWNVFHNVFDLNPVLFFDTFCSFVVNALLDDSAFRIEHRKIFTDTNNDIVWENGGYKTCLSSKEDLKAEPIVYYDNDGSQNVSLLMEAMDKAELLEDLRNKSSEKFQALFKK